MEDRFVRNLGALTEEECRRLGEKTLLLAGCGGLGGHLLELLLRAGAGRIVAADPERFEPTNLNRQILCTGDTLGRSKAEAAAERAAALGLDGRVVPRALRLDEDNLPELLAGCDAVLDALDSAEDRRTLKRACDRAGLAYFHGAASGWRAQAALSLPGDGFLDRLYPPGEVPREAGVLSFAPALAAALQASLCVRWLCGRPVEPGRLYALDLREMNWFALDMTETEEERGSDA